ARVLASFGVFATCGELIAISLPSGEKSRASGVPLDSIERARTFVPAWGFQRITPDPGSWPLNQLPALANRLPSGENATALAWLCATRSCLSVPVLTSQTFSLPESVANSPTRPAPQLVATSSNDLPPVARR